MSYHHGRHGIIPIEEKFLRNNEEFALEFREGFVFGRVIRRRICQYKPYPLIDSNGLPVLILPNTTQPELRFRDPRNSQNAILYLESTTKVGLPWFFHGAFGLKPNAINMYLRYPEGDVIPGKFPAVDPIRPAAGDDISALNGIVSPFEQPTDYHEVVIAPQQHISAEYYNKDLLRAFQPIINIYFALYFAQIYKAETQPMQIANIAARKYEGDKANFLTVGFGDQAEDIAPQVSKDWGVTPMNLDDAMSLGGR